MSLPPFVSMHSYICNGAFPGIQEIFLVLFSLSLSKHTHVKVWEHVQIQLILAL